MAAHLHNNQHVHLRDVLHGHSYAHRPMRHVQFDGHDHNHGQLIPIHSHDFHDHPHNIDVPKDKPKLNIKPKRK